MDAEGFEPSFSVCNTDALPLNYAPRRCPFSSASGRPQHTGLVCFNDVEKIGFEPTTFALQKHCATVAPLPHWSLDLVLLEYTTHRAVSSARVNPHRIVQVILVHRLHVRLCDLEHKKRSSSCAACRRVTYDRRIFQGLPSRQQT